MFEPVLAHFEEHLPTHLQTNASGYGIGEVLVQVHDGKERPVSYASRTLMKAEKNYSTTKRECLAMMLPPGVSWTDKDSGWCAAGFLAKLSLTVGLNSQHSGLVAIAFPSRPRCALWARYQATLLATEDFGKIEDNS
ncbi:K02A2.6-like [Cordylochernes scorpioides]|uniref:K02A2.6-like n=1 Tax=Cordylochernes scorpioides TaxID=51811 RepID=A0ABY6L5S5_9ARAC|nr:K02A2.6-like [Cordylochernes scorpioides]